MSFIITGLLLLIFLLLLNFAVNLQKQLEVQHREIIRQIDDLATMLGEAITEEV